MSFPQQPRHTRIELEVEPEPEMIEMTHGHGSPVPFWNRRLFVPASWSPERRTQWLEWWMSW